MRGRGLTSLAMWKGFRVLLTASYWRLRNLRLRYPQLCTVGMADEEPAAKRVRTEDGEDGCTEPAEGTACGTTEGEEAVEGEKEESVEGGKVVRIKRRKCALLISYNGKGYLGMQINPGSKTIERDLLEALARADAIPDSLKFDVGKLQFQRCSRTDKGVSAARQVVSLKMSPIQSIIEVANQHLPPQIRIMGFRRVTRSFNSKNACSSRLYEYLMPTFAFAPYRLTTLDYRIDKETLSKVGRLLQQYEKSHNFHNFTSGKKFDEQSSNRYIISFKCNTPFLATISLQGEYKEQSGTETQGAPDSTVEPNSEGGSTEAKSKVEHKGTVESAEDMERSGSMEDNKEGTMEGQECWRSKEVEFVTLQVKGQSFMIHQIRKMIGLVIAIVRGFTPETTLVEAFGKKKIDIPRAPSLGLLLDNVFFDGYNRRYASDGTRQPLDWTECEEKVETFKREHIYQSMIDTEISQKSMMQWLGSLQIHEFHQTQHRLEVAQALSMKTKEGEEELREGEEKTKQEVEQEEGREQDDVEEKTSTDQSQCTSSSTLSAGEVPLSQKHTDDCHSTTE